jgi:hypothetical protein
MTTIAQIREALEQVAHSCTANARDCATEYEFMDARHEADVALAAKNWTAAALSAAQAYKTFGTPAGGGHR